MIQDDDLRMSFLPTVPTVARSSDQIQAHTPVLSYLSDGEIDRIDKEREKELNKRRKRNTRGRRGIALPDREPIKTHRTPAIGFPEVDPATISMVNATVPPTARRAAAAAASVNIANMVASENGTTIIPPSTSILPLAPTPVVSKIPKARGSFKAPPLPGTVYTSRAKILPPTPSTAADPAIFAPPLEGDKPLPPMISAVAPDSKAAKVLTARRQRELDKEAKEKEFADGQHANVINGIWHCSNCGCPDNIAVGRRKGPLGDKSQCGPCGKYISNDLDLAETYSLSGKFWHRHRRPRPVEYHADPEYHLKLLAETEKSKAQAKKRNPTAVRSSGAQRERTPFSGLISTGEILPVNKIDPWVENISQKGSNTASHSRAISPASSVTSSASERPLAQTILHNGPENTVEPSSPPSAPLTSSPPSHEPDQINGSDSQLRLSSPAAVVSNTTTPTLQPATSNQTTPPVQPTDSVAALPVRFPSLTSRVQLLTDHLSILFPC